MDIVSINDLTVEFMSEAASATALNRVSFSIPHNKTVALVGESGSGKSVIAQTIMGLLPQKAHITNGQILFSDPDHKNKAIDITALERNGTDMRRLRGNRIAMIFQEPMTSFSPLHTIGDQIGEAAQLHLGLTAKNARTATRDMLKLVHFPNPERALDTYPFELSGGLRQRAMIAMALICRPALLIADEPTTALDVTIQAEILKLIRDIQTELSMSVLMITHDFGVVANMADDVVVIYHGKIMERGPVEDIFRNPRHDYLKALLRAVPRFNMAADEKLIPIRPIETKPGSFLLEKQADGGQPGEMLLKVERLSKTYSQRKGHLFKRQEQTFKALNDVSLHVKRGECLGIVGESGSGKTTLAKAIMHAISIDEGTLHFNDKNGLKDITVLEGKMRQTYRRQVQYIFQDPFSSLSPRMTIFDILSEPLIINNIGDADERFERIKELMELVGLDIRFLRRYPHSFSGGQRQRIGIARALALKPQLVLCDEPVSALDVSVQAQILNLLKDLKDKLGLTYIFVSHNLAVVDYIADRTAVMCRGRIVEIAPTQDLIAHPQHPYTQALIAAIPEPDIDDKLDFAALSEGRASDPSAWPEPYRLEDGMAAKFVEISNGHFVCTPGLTTQTNHYQDSPA